MVLVRVGDPAPVSPYDQAKRMARRWSAKLKELRKHPKHEPGKRPTYTTRREVNQMLVLADKLWPTDKALALFDLVISNWSVFMVGVKGRYFQHEAVNGDDELPFFHLPNIGLICRYSDVVLEMAAFPSAHEVPDIELKATLKGR
jgi:hypothetical protein